MKKNIIVAIATMTLTACATDPDNIQSASVSTMQYNNYDCEQLSMESERVFGRRNQLYAGLKKTANDDAMQMGVGLVLFWPALFFLEGGDDARAPEYARLKGEQEAIEKASIQKRCGIRFQKSAENVDEKKSNKESLKDGVSKDN